MELADYDSHHTSSFAPQSHFFARPRRQILVGIKHSLFQTPSTTAGDTLNYNRIIISPKYNRAAKYDHDYNPIMLIRLLIQPLAMAWQSYYNWKVIGLFIM